MNFWENAGYSADGPCEENNSQPRGAQNAGTQGMNAEFARRLGGFAGKSEEQLMGELAEAVKRMKAEGTFDPSALERLYLTSSPFLSETQRERMRAIIDMLK